MSIPLNAVPELEDRSPARNFICAQMNAQMKWPGGKRAVVLPPFLLLVLFFQSAAAESPHPLLTAVCRNDYAAAAELSPRRLDLDGITWGGRNLRALDLAVVNGHWEIATLLMNSGARVSGNTLTAACNLKHAKAICVRNPKWRHHQTCRSAEDPTRWSKNCRAPDGYCRKILEQ